MSPLKALTLSLLLLAVAVFGGGSLYLHQKGDRLLSVQTNSMVPAFRPGDALLTKRVSLHELLPGDIVSYRRPDDNRVIVSHRLVGVNFKTGRLMTAGDANSRADVPFPFTQVVGKTYKIVPHLGSFLNWLHTFQGLCVVLYIPAGLVLLLETRRLAKNLRYKKYQYKKSYA